jgi:preprotein translocase subunit YajC
MIYYSPSKNGFYTTGLQSAIPDDKIEITEEQHAALLDGLNSQGKTISVVGGVPTLIDKVYTDDEKIAASNVTIKAKLRKVDASAVRSLRSVLVSIAKSETPSANDIAKLAGYETQASTLRAGLK